MTKQAKQAILLTAQLIERRDLLKRVLPEAYAKQVPEFRKILRETAEVRGKDLCDMALEMGKKMSDAGHDPCWLFAALVDEMGVA